MYFEESGERERDSLRSNRRLETYECRKNANKRGQDAPDRDAYDRYLVDVMVAEGCPNDQTWR